MSSDPKKADFGVGNLALIVAVAGVLIFLAVQQHPVGISDGQQVALLSPPPSYSSSVSGATALASAAQAPQVLGAVTYNKDFVNQLNIDVQTLDNNSGSAIVNYARQVSLVFQGDKVSDGQAAHLAKFLEDIKLLAAPSSVKDYQKLLIAKYQLDYFKISGQDDSNVEAMINAVGQQYQIVHDSLAQSYAINIP